MSINPEHISPAEPGRFVLSMEATHQVYEHQIANGGMTLNQIRAHQGLGPLPYGDSLRAVKKAA